MIKIIGYNRVVIIVVLALIAAGLFFYNQRVLGPDIKKQRGELSSIEAESSEISENLNRLKNQLSNFDKEKADFAQVQSLGFFDEQDRVQARSLISAIQKDSRLVNARFAIKPAKTIVNEDLKNTGYKIIETRIDFDLEAVEDVDIYKFIYSLSYGFPGQIIIRDISLSRDVDVTLPLLRKIGVGQSQAIVKGKLVVDWKTMVEDSSAQAVSDNVQAGGY